MKFLASVIVIVAFFAACCKSKEPFVCTQEFRIISLQVVNPQDQPIALDSFYTTRISNNERFTATASSPSWYPVLDDSYHQKLRNKEDRFRFTGWRNGAVVVNELYTIGADACHIFKISGSGKVMLQ